MPKPWLPLVLVLAGAATPARACFAPEMETGLLLDAPPVSIPAGSVAAQVEIVSVSRRSARYLTLEARVLSVLDGAVEPKTIRIALLETTSCDLVPRPGDRGIVLGRVLFSHGGVLVVDLTRRQPSSRAARVFGSLMR